MTRTKPPNYSLFHSFPRFSCKSPAEEIERGFAILESILDIGLLLCPERLYFPLLENATENYNRGSFVHQKRICFTFVDCSEILRHAATFGSFSLEFDISTIRALGGMPVVYIPRPTSSEAITGFDFFFNNLVHQIRDVQTLLQELENINIAVSQANAQKLSQLEIPGQTPIDVSAVEFILRYLKGNKGDFKSMRGYLVGMSNVFYHADSARLGEYFLEMDLAYYRQMEWRIIAGLKYLTTSLDEALNDNDVIRLTGLDPFFSKLELTPQGKEVPKTALIRKASNFNGAPILECAKAVWVPDVAETMVREMFRKKGIRKEIRGLAYSKIMQVRASSK
jgi:hypothetical protein